MRVLDLLKLDTGLHAYHLRWAVTIPSWTNALVGFLKFSLDEIEYSFNKTSDPFEFSFVQTQLEHAVVLHNNLLLDY